MFQREAMEGMPDPACGGLSLGRLRGEPLRSSHQRAVRAGIEDLRLIRMSQTEIGDLHNEISLVSRAGLEPATLCLKGTCSTT